MSISDYKVVEYIKSTGTQYIITDIIPNVTDKIIIDLKFGSVIDISAAAVTGYFNLIGVSGYGVTFSQFSDNNRDMSFYLGYSWYSGLQNFQINNPNNITTRQNLTIKRGGSSYGGKSCSANATVTITPASPIDIFGYYKDTAGSEQHFYYRGFELYVYGINIFDSTNALTHNILPVERISDGELGLYDSITDKFYSNAGTGSFAKGDYVALWLIDEGGNITNTNFIDLPSAAMATPYPFALWRIEEGYNDGLPFNMLMADVPAFGAFANATNLAVIRIPQSVKSIGVETFRNTNLTSVTIASDCTYYDTSFPEGCVVNFYPD